MVDVAVAHFSVQSKRLQSNSFNLPEVIKWSFVRILLRALVAYQFHLIISSPAAVLPPILIS